MSTNPYSPPVDAAEVEEEVQPPRYLGRLRTIQGSLDWEEALEYVKACKPMELGEVKAPQPQPTWTAKLMVVLMLLVAFLFVFGLEGSGATGGFLGWWCIGVPLAFVGVILFFSWLLGRSGHWASSDPPIDGELLLKLGELGCSVEKLTRDHRPIEVFCSWRQLTVTEGPDAWLFQMGLVTPVSLLVSKHWIDDDLDRFDLRGFSTGCRSMACDAAARDRDGRCSRRGDRVVP